MFRRCLGNGLGDSLILVFVLFTATSKITKIIFQDFMYTVLCADSYGAVHFYHLCAKTSKAKIKTKSTYWGGGG